MRLIHTSAALVRDNLRVFLALHVLAYLPFFVGMAAALLVPGLNADAVGAQDADGTTDLVASLMSRPAMFALTILAVNVFTVALATILLPSMLVPFLGLALFAWRTYGFGVTLAPVDHVTALVLIPHSVTILIEFEAYIVVALGAFLLGRAWLRPHTVGAPNRRGGYARGLRQVGCLLVPALVLFVIGAAYEAIELAYLVPALVR